MEGTVMKSGFIQCCQETWHSNRDLRKGIFTEVWTGFQETN